MKTAKEFIVEYVQSERLMQVATAKNNTPWVCSVYFVADDKLQLYWLSYPNRRHSEEIHENNKVAITIAVKQDHPVIGIQGEGTAHKVMNPVTIAKIMVLYIKKYGLGQKFYDNFLQQKNKHFLYCFTPNRYALFDEEHFKEEYAQEIVVRHGDN